MKKFFVCAFMLISSVTLAQVPAEENRLNELSKMGKINLANIYLANLESLFINAPNFPLVDSGENVPDNKYLGKRWKSINRSNFLHLNVLHNNYQDLLPYANKQDLINAIMYLEQVNKNLSK